MRYVSAASTDTDRYRSGLKTGDGLRPLAGFPSCGEIAPFRLPDGTCTPTSFHNETFVVCLSGG